MCVLFDLVVLKLYRKYDERESHLKYVICVYIVGVSECCCLNDSHMLPNMFDIPVESDGLQVPFIIYLYRVCNQLYNTLRLDSFSCMHVIIVCV